MKNHSDDPEDPEEEKLSWAEVIAEFAAALKVLQDAIIELVQKMSGEENEDE